MDRYSIASSLIALAVAAAPAAAQPPAAQPAPARAAPSAPPAPVIAPAESWVEALAIPAPNPALKDRPLQGLLLSAQSRYGKDGSNEHYIEIATRVQTPQGLPALGNVVIPWQPDLSELVVHKVQIIRDGKVIDLLATQQFTVLRRENNLESAMLDGVLTAVLQPEGLAVGDIVDIAWTLKLKPQPIPFRAENEYAVMHGLAVRHLRYREIWEDGVPMRWQATAPMAGIKPKKGKWGNELVADLENAEAPELPDGVPTRFRLASRFEVSAYPDWAEISRMMAPLYDKAKQLGPASPLAAEIQRISAASPDPAKRAMAALRLVQDKIRYLALAMGDGGYVPAAADQTWARKFGDCKGKTVVLLALLSGLGIEAEPILVSSAMGDGLDERLPRVNSFDHVLVQAKIGGRVYWLDGTRLGDRDLDGLASSPFHWGLPLAPAGAALERLPLLPPALPISEASVTYDASKGFEGPVPFQGRLVFRGDYAAGIRLALTQVGKDQLKSKLMESVHGAPSGEQISQFDVASDEEAGTATVSFAGKARMEWAKAPGANAQRFHFDDDTIQWTMDFARPDGPGKDLPFALPNPVYLQSSETVILPRGGAGFTIEGHDLDRVVAGVHVARKVVLEGGRATARSTFLRIEPEISAKEGLAAAKSLAEINADRVYLRSPIGYQASAEERSAALAVEPTGAEGFTDRGARLMSAGRLDAALADFDHAASLSPNWSRAHADRAFALVRLGRLADARAALDKAATLADDDSATWEGYGLLALAQGRPADAVEALTRALALANGDSAILTSRAAAYEQLGKYDEATTDLQGARANSPDDNDALAELARLQARKGNQAEALASADRFIAGAPDEAEPVHFKAGLLSRFGRAADAAPLYARAVTMIDGQIAREKDAERKRGLASLKVTILADAGDKTRAVQEASGLIAGRPGDAFLLNERCWARATLNFELDLALADCEAAVRGKPDYAAAVDSRAFVKLRLGRFDDAIADYDLAVRLAPQQAASWYGRAIARLRKGDRTAAERDLATARRLSFDIDARFKLYGVAAPD